MPMIVMVPAAMGSWEARVTVLLNMPVGTASEELPPRGFPLPLLLLPIEYSILLRRQEDNQDSARMNAAICCRPLKTQFERVSSYYTKGHAARIGYIGSTQDTA